MDNQVQQKKGYLSSEDRKRKEEEEKRKGASGKGKSEPRKPAFIEEREDGLQNVILSLNHFYSPMDEKVLTRAVISQEGVSSCTANYRSGEVSFVLDPEKNTVENIEKVCADLSYPPGEGLDGFWLDVACAIVILALYIFIPKGLERFGVTEETLRAIGGAGGFGMTFAGFVFIIIGLKLWGISFLKNLNIKIGEEIPAHYNKWAWKIGTMLLVLLGLLILGYGVSTF